MSRVPDPGIAHDELARLNDELANLQRDLTRRNRELERLRTHLEETVLERTRALEAANAALSRELVERKRAEEEIQLRERTLHDLLDGLGEGFLAALLSPDGTILTVNEAGLSATGERRSEVVGRHPRDTGIFAHSEASQTRIEDGIRAAAAGEPRRFDVEALTPIGIRTLDTSIRPIRGPDGRVERLVGRAIDVTERITAERAAREAEQRYHSVISNAPIMIWAMDRDGRITLSEGRGLELVDLRPGELVGRTVFDVYESYPQIVESTQRALRGEAFRDQVAVGELVFDVAYSPVRDARGEVSGVVGVATDVSERARTERDLAATRETLNLALDAASIGLWTWDPGTNDVYYSPRWKAQLGYEAPDLGTGVDEFLDRLHPDDRGHLWRVLAKFAEEPWPHYEEEFRLRHRDGRWRWFLSRATTQTDDSGRVTRVIGANIDVTERREAEERLRDNARELRELSRRLIESQETERRHIARELHDQIGQVLTAVKLTLRTFERQLPPGRLGESLELVDEAVQQVRDMSLDLRPSLLDDLGLIPALRWQVDRSARRARLAAQFVSEVPEQRFGAELETACFRIVQEALTNVVRHASASSVRVRLTREADHLVVEVADDGCGFAAGDLIGSSVPRSIGLAGMQERAQLVGGTLAIESRPGAGTIVRARVPAPGEEG